MVLSEKNDLIQQFLHMLGIVRKLFRLIHIEVENSSIFRKVETTVSPFIDEIGSLDEKASLSIFLDAEIENSIDKEKQSLGVSLTIRYHQQFWLAEGEIGWSGKSVGWDNYIDREYKSEDIDDFIIELPSFVKKLLEQYKVEYKKLRSRLG